MKLYRTLLIGGILLVTAALALGVGAQEPPSDPHGEPPTFLRGLYDAWVASPHAQADAEAFVHWDAEGEIPETCAQCHSTPGYLDFLGADGSAAGTVDAPAPIGTVINCDACHNRTAASLSSVTFPSGVELVNLNESARCMVCHQGRASGNSVTVALEEAGMSEDLDTVSEDLGFINIHYYAAASTLYGAEVQGGYQFAGLSYQIRSDHVEGYNTCTDCHSAHTLEVRVTECTTCHEDVETAEDLRSIRMVGSLVDYDGDGDVEEGIAGEIETLQEMLYATIQAYASEVAGTPIVYDDHAYPYFFVDTNANGELDEGEAVFPNAYKAFTGRLVQATYNFQVTKKDPAGYVHNPKYHIELLIDSIEALNSALSQPVDLSQTRRNDAGHFDSTATAFRYWDAQGEVPGTCAKCHTDSGLPTFLKNNANIAVEPANSLACSTCHSDFSEFGLHSDSLADVTFPSGAKVTFGEEEPANICLNCHQGRESTVSVNRAISGAGVGDDEVSPALAFRNIHYFAAGASLFGAEAQGAYQYADKEYNGRFEHARRMETCIDCHTEHTLELRVDLCTDCHEDVETVEDVRLIRMEDDDVDPVDYDGDGDTSEPIAEEIATFKADLRAAIYSYAADTIGTPIAYDAHSHPYWFIDTNANGEADADEVNRENSYNQWTPNLLRAAFNYQYASKDPGVYAHNADYILQVMYDSLESLGADVANYTRPPVRESEED